MFFRNIHCRHYSGGWVKRCASPFCKSARSVSCSVLSVFVCVAFVHISRLNPFRRTQRTKETVFFYDADSVHIKHCRYQVKFKRKNNKSKGWFVTPRAKKRRVTIRVSRPWCVRRGLVCLRLLSRGVKGDCGTRQITRCVCKLEKMCHSDLAVCLFLSRRRQVRGCHGYPE